MKKADILYDYIIRTRCPHDICSGPEAESWNREMCDKFNDPEMRHIYPRPCKACWDAFIREYKEVL